jgi:hypothetical protein
MRPHPKTKMNHMKKFQAGEIYFIREAEEGSEKLSLFVKVGLVRY